MVKRLEPSFFSRVAAFKSDHILGISASSHLAVEAVLRLEGVIAWWVLGVLVLSEKQQDTWGGIDTSRVWLASLNKAWQVYESMPDELSRICYSMPLADQVVEPASMILPGAEG